MASQDQSMPIPPNAPINPQSDSAVDHQIPPQEYGASTSTYASTSTISSQVSVEEPTTADSSVANSHNIPRLSAATAELLARANGSWTNPQFHVSYNDSAAMNSSNSTGGNTCSIPGGLSLGMTDAPALEKGEEGEKKEVKGVWMLASNSSLSHDDHKPNETISSTDNMMSQQPQPTTPDRLGVHNAVKSNGNVIPTASNPTSAKIVHLRNIAPRPSSKPLAATLTSGSKRQATTTTKTTRRRSGQKAPKKRKTGRNNGADDDDGVIKAGDSSSEESSDEATPVTTQTKSGRQIHRPTVFYPVLSVTGSGSPTGPDASSSSQPRKRRRVYRKGKEMNVICKRCERGHSPAGNVIVFCDDCNRPWHQFCHDPPIEKEVITVKELEWFCKECRPPVDASSDEMQPTSSIYQLSANKIDTSNYLPILPSETKVGGAQFSLEQKRGYICSLSHSHLVSILLDISSSTPDLPIFPENLPDLPSSTLAQPAAQAPTTQSSTSDKPPLISGKSTTSVSTLATQNSLTTPQSSVTGLLYLPPAAADLSTIAGGNSPTPKNDDEPSDEEEYMYVEDHRLYPRAGNGFRLPPDSEDLDILLEDPSCTTFSHSLHGLAKEMMLETSGLPMVVCGAA